MLLEETYTTKPLRRATANQAGLGPGIAELASMEFLLERLFGKPIWLSPQGNR
jgi:hypothetical protein